MPNKTCSWGTCKNSSRKKGLEEGVTFKRFPQPNTQRQRCLEWIRLCNRSHERLNIDKVGLYHYVCSKHFEDGADDPILASDLTMTPTSSRKPRQRATRKQQTSNSESEMASSLQSAEPSPHKGKCIESDWQNKKRMDETKAGYEKVQGDCLNQEQTLKQICLQVQELVDELNEMKKVATSPCCITYISKAFAKSDLLSESMTRFEEQNKMVIAMTKDLARIANIKAEQKQKRKSDLNDTDKDITDLVEDVSFRLKDEIDDIEDEEIEPLDYDSDEWLDKTDHTEDNLNTEQSGIVATDGEAIRRGDGSEKYSCTICNSTFGVKQKLMEHLRGHTKMKKSPKEKLHECGICSRTFHSMIWKLKHLESCMKKEVEELNSEKKVSVKKKNEVVKCEMCDQTFKSSSGLEAHKKLHTEDGLFLCIVCDKVFYKYEDLTEHKKVHKPVTGQKNTVCDVCGKTFKDPKYMKIHVRVHTGEKPYVCETCGKGFADKRDLRKHTRTHTGEKTSFCEYCGKGFSRPMYLTHHRRIHTGEKPFMCDQCPNAYSRRGELKKHIDKVHLGIKTPMPLEKNFKCDQCDARYARKAALVHHQERHSTTYDWICEDCGKAFQGKKTLQRHRLCHNILGKPFDCKICGKKFARNAFLKMHMLCHSTERPWECPTCRKTFVRRSDMRIHQRIHTGYKPYKCHLCDFSTARAYRLTIHKRLHLGRKEFKCESCGEEFYRRFDLLTHKKKYHGHVSKWKPRPKGKAKFQVIRVNNPNLVYPDENERASLAKITADYEAMHQPGPSNFSDLESSTSNSQSILTVQRDQHLHVPEHEGASPSRAHQSHRMPVNGGQPQMHMQLVPNPVSGAPAFLAMQSNHIYEQNRFTPLQSDPNFVPTYVREAHFYHM